MAYLKRNLTNFFCIPVLLSKTPIIARLDCDLKIARFQEAKKNLDNAFK